MRGAAVPIHSPLFALFTSGAAPDAHLQVQRLNSTVDTRYLRTSPLSQHASKYLLHSNDSSHSIESCLLGTPQYRLVDYSASSKSISSPAGSTDYRWTAGDARQKSSHGDSARLKESDGQQNPSEENARNHRHHHLCAGRDRDEPIGTGPPTSLPPCRKT